MFLYRIDMWRPQCAIQMQFAFVNNGQRQRVFPSYYKAQTVTVVMLTRWVLMPSRPFHSPVKSFHSTEDAEAEGANMFTTLRFVGGIKSYICLKFLNAIKQSSEDLNIIYLH